MQSQSECVNTLEKRIESLLKDIEQEKTFMCFGAKESSEFIMSQCHIDGMHTEIDMISEHIRKIESGEMKVYSEEDDYQEP